MAKTKEEAPAVTEAMRVLSLNNIPEEYWVEGGDNYCDCLFQNVLDYNNPHIGRTIRYRMCCLLARLFKDHPDLIQEMPYYDRNRHTYNPEPTDWDSFELDMPIPLWHRQLAIREGKTIAEIRVEYAGRERERPKKVKARKARQPSMQEIEYAHTMQLRASGWLLEDETVESIQNRR